MRKNYKLSVLILLSWTILICGCQKDKEAPLAAFMADKTNITESDTVQFTDQSANSPSSWQWSFGDGISSSLQHPTHIYDEAGIYTVSLSVTNSNGSDTEAKEDYIIVNVEFQYYTDPRDNQVYKVIEIGSQTWFAENLRATRYSDGTPIPECIANCWYPKWYCWFNNDSAKYAANYGALYNWTTAVNGDSSGPTDRDLVQGICPDGWHLPSDSEWKKLELALGMQLTEVDTTGFRGGDEGGKMKVAGTSFWNSPNLGATNESGFSALPGGSGCGGFSPNGINAFFWSSTENDYSAWIRALNYDRKDVYRYYYEKRYGLSVRCVKD